MRIIEEKIMKSEILLLIIMIIIILEIYILLTIAPIVNIVVIIYITIPKPCKIIQQKIKKLFMTYAGG